MNNGIKCWFPDSCNPEMALALLAADVQHRRTAVLYALGRQTNAHQGSHITVQYSLLFVPRE